MLKKFSRYYHTIKYLKPIQIRYQIWYRIRNRFFPVKLPGITHTPQIQKLTLKPFPKEKLSYLGKKTFRFLNLEHDFGTAIDWNYAGFGKLWAYKLNYFEFLHQPDMDKDTGFGLIREFIQEIGTNTEGLEPYPISLRGINWIKFMAVHQEYPDDIVQSLYAQYGVLRKNFEYHLLGNHLLENGFSLLFAGIFFKDEDFLNKSEEILFAELDEQILDDGAHFELSPMYHCIILQRVLDSINLLSTAENNRSRLEEMLRRKGELMLSWLKEVQFSNGDLPMVNDSLHKESVQVALLEEYAKRLGIVHHPVKLGASGYRKITSNGFELFTDVGQIGPDYIPGHAHSDTLSFLLYYKNEPVIVDRGVSTYLKSKLREEERSTYSHNTVIINHTEQSDVWGGFRVGKRAHGFILKDDPDQKYLKAYHDGYQKINCKHCREWAFTGKELIIKDEIEGNPESSFAYLHLHPVCTITKVAENEFKVGGLTVVIENSDSIKLKPYLYCSGFNTLVSSTAIEIGFHTQLKTIFTP